MKPRELILLSSYTYPAHSPLTLTDEDMAAWMNAYTALWHPAVLWGASEPPRIDVPYDYEKPQRHHVYGVPDSPPMVMPENWEKRVQKAGAVLLPGEMDRNETLEKAKAAFTRMAPHVPDEAQSKDASGEPPNADEENPSENQESKKPAEPKFSPEEVHAKLIALEPEQLRPFFAIGLGHLFLAALSEGMEHDNLLETEDFWQDIQKAIAALVGLSDERPESFGGTNPDDYSSENYSDSDYPATDHDNFDGDNPANFEEHEDLPEDPQYDDLPHSESHENDDHYPHEDGDYPHDDSWQDHNYQDSYSHYDTGGGRDTTPFEGRYQIDPDEAEPWLAWLHSAAQRILSAREVLYPVTIYLLDLFFADENSPAENWPTSLERHVPLNVVMTGSTLEKLKDSSPELMQKLREAMDAEEVEVCGGCYQQREDSLLPVESQLWNILKGRAVAEELLGKPLDVFARKRFYGHPNLPLFLSSCGFNRALSLDLNDDVVAGQENQSIVVSWPSTDGKQVDAFVRQPYKADSFETWYNFGYYLFKTTREDHSATIPLLHSGKKAFPWYDDFLELCRFGPILGEWLPLSRYFNDVMAGEYKEPQSADDFHFDHLSERTPQEEQESPPTDVPVSGFAAHARLRRYLDACTSLCGMFRGLAGRNDQLQLHDRLSEIENRIETQCLNSTEHVAEIEQQLIEIEREILEAFSGRLQSQAAENQPGYLIINPCSFKRRIALELDRPEHSLPVEDPIKACQMDEDKMRIVIETPALGFAWFPRSGPAGTPAPKMRMRLADKTHVRNEFFEAEIDPKTGGLSGITDQRTSISRIAQRLVFNPGSDMKVNHIEVVSEGPALGEVVSEGEIVDAEGKPFAAFRQRFRAWRGRPVLEMRIEINPAQPPIGYPWHAYYGCRFAWADERGLLVRGVSGMGHVTNHTRPQSPDYLELQTHGQRTAIFPGGLPFVQRNDTRHLDIILIPQGETATTFDIAVGLERNYPMQTALGLHTPVSIIPTEKGPPHVGATGWLYHLDTPNLMLTKMVAGGQEVPGEYADESQEQGPKDLFDAVTLHLIEIANQSGQAEFHSVRNPQQAVQLDARGQRVLDLTASDDAVFLEVTPGDLNLVQVEFE